MNWMRIFLLISIVFIDKSIGDDTRSVKMSIMKNSLFQCASTTCLPFITLTVSTVRQCQMACLANNRCQAASFHQTNSNCELFDNIASQNGNMTAQTNIVTMIAISGTRVPPG